MGPSGLLAVMLAITALAGRSLGFRREDRLAITICGSTKSLVTGIPADVLFAGHAFGLIVFPLMIFFRSS
jgi:sodium/bile acid cotransporter 7